MNAGSLDVFPNKLADLRHNVFDANRAVQTVIVVRLPFEDQCLIRQLVTKQESLFFSLHQFSRVRSTLLGILRHVMLCRFNGHPLRK